MAPVKSGATGSEGFFPIFNRKSGISEYLLHKYSGSPRPSATPLINAGGKIESFFDSLNCDIICVLRAACNCLLNRNLKNKEILICRKRLPKGGCGMMGLYERSDAT